MRGEPSRHGVTRSEFVSRQRREGLGYRALAQAFWGHLQESDPRAYKRLVDTARNWWRWGERQAAPPPPPRPDPGEAVEQFRQALRRPAAPAPPELPEAPEWDPTTGTREEYLVARIKDTQVFILDCQGRTHSGSAAQGMKLLDDLRGELEAERARVREAADPLELLSDEDLVEKACGVAARLPGKLREPIEEALTAARRGRVLQMPER